MSQHKTPPNSHGLSQRPLSTDCFAKIPNLAVLSRTFNASTYSSSRCDQGGGDTTVSGSDSSKPYLGFRPVDCEHHFPACYQCSGDPAETRVFSSPTQIARAMYVYSHPSARTTSRASRVDRHRIRIARGTTRPNENDSKRHGSLQGHQGDHAVHPRQQRLARSSSSISSPTFASWPFGCPGSTISGDIARRTSARTPSRRCRRVNFGPLPGDTPAPSPSWFCYDAPPWVAQHDDDDDEARRVGPVGVEFVRLGDDGHDDHDEPNMLIKVNLSFPEKVRLQVCCLFRG